MVRKQEKSGESNDAKKRETMASPSVKYLRSETIDSRLLKQLESLEFSATGTRRICLHENENATLHRMIVECSSDSSFPRHYHTDSDEIITAINGTLQIEIWKNGLSNPPNTVCIGFDTGQTLVAFIPQNTPHSTKALSERCIYLEIKLGPFRRESICLIEDDRENP